MGPPDGVSDAPDLPPFEPVWTGWSRRAVAALAVVGVLLTVALAWRVSEEARGGWWVNEPHVAVGPDADGVLRHHGVEVVVQAVEPVTDAQEWGERWVPPEGFAAWAVTLDVLPPSDDEFRGWSVYLEDDRGRIFDTQESPSLDGMEWGFDFSAPDEGEEFQAEQTVPFLLPEDATPAVVRIETGWGGGGSYLRLPVG